MTPLCPSCFRFHGGGEYCGNFSESLAVPESIVDESKFDDIDPNFELPHHDTARGVVRPRLIVLNAWLKVCQEMSSEGNWGRELAEELCDDDWCILVLMEAGVSEVNARSWADSEWK